MDCSGLIPYSMPFAMIVGIIVATRAWGEILESQCPGIFTIEGHCK
jgi:hypothetical protein